MAAANFVSYIRTQGMEVGTILQLCKSSNVIMFVYSITDRRTYEQTKEVIEKVLKITNENKIEW